MAPLHKVALIGGSGRIGSAILNALVVAEFAVTVISRISSKVQYPSSVHTVRVANDYAVEDLIDAFRGHDAVVCAIANAHGSQQTKIIDAAVLAGVKRFIPSDFGSNPTEAAIELLPIYYAGKTAILGHLQEVEDKMTWTTIRTGPVFDIVMNGNILGIDLPNHKATVCKSGTIEWSTTTLKTVGLTVTKVLCLPEETANRVLYVQSFVTSDLALLRACEEATNSKFEVKYLESEQQKVDGKLMMSSGEVLPALGCLLRYQRSVPGYSLDHSADVANQLLGLPEETLEASIEKLLKK